MKTLYTINTVNNFTDLIYRPFGVPFCEENPDLVMYNIMDDSLLKDTLKYEGMTPVIAGRMLNYAKAAEASGADGVLVTCTSVNQATALIKPLLTIPIINIEEPVAEQAVENGKRIGILATLPSSPKAIGRVIEQKAQQNGKQVELVVKVAEGAFDVLCAGDRPKHDEMVLAALAELAKEVDVIAFAQISMSLLPHGDVGVPIYKIGRSGYEKIYSLMSEK